MPLDDAALSAFLDLAFDHLCGRPVSELVDRDRVLAGLDAAAASDGLSRAQSRLYWPARERFFDRAARSAVKLGAWLPEPARDALSDLIGAPMPLPEKLVDELVGSEDVREEVREMLQDSITGFLKKGLGTTGGSLLGMGARAFGAAGRGLFGSLGDEVGQRLQDRVREFVDGTVASLQERIAKKLASEETARAFAKRRRKGFLKLLEKTEAEAAEIVRPWPHAAFDALAPTLLRHNLGREEIRAALREEIDAALAEIGKSTVGEVLDDFGLREVARESLHAHGLPIARTLVATAAFGDWWTSAHAS
jgi:hypothetical protein